MATKIATLMEDIAKPFKNVGAKEAAEFASFVGTMSFMTAAFGKLQGKASGSKGKQLATIGNTTLATLGNRSLVAKNQAAGSGKQVGWLQSQKKEKGVSLVQVYEGWLDATSELRQAVGELPKTLNTMAFGPLSKITANTFGSVKGMFTTWVKSAVDDSNERRAIDKKITDLSERIALAQMQGVSQSKIAALMDERTLAVEERTEKGQKKGFAKMTGKLGDMLTTMRFGFLTSLGNIAAGLLPLLGKGMLVAAIVTALDQLFSKFFPAYTKAIETLKVATEQGWMRLRAFLGGDKESKAVLAAQSAQETLKVNSKRSLPLRMRIAEGELRMEEAQTRLDNLQGQTGVKNWLRRQAAQSDYDIGKKVVDTNTAELTKNSKEYVTATKAFLDNRQQYQLAKAKEEGSSEVQLQQLKNKLEVESSKYMKSWDSMNKLVEALATYSRITGDVLAKPIQQIINNSTTNVNTDNGVIKTLSGEN